MLNRLDKQSNVFEPKVVRVNVGDTVLWKAKDKGHNVSFIAVNDPFVMKSWSEASNADGIDMLADGNCDLTNELGLTMDGSAFGLGNRCKRFAMIVDNGIVQSIDIEDPGAMDVSSAESQLAKI